MNKENDVIFDGISPSLSKRVVSAPRERLLLHSCCGPCSSAVIERLLPDFELTVLYYNPNIYPEEEYERRVLAQRRIIDAFGQEHHIELVLGEYGPESFDELAAGLESAPEGGERCRICFAQRLRGAAKYAASHGFGYFTTTLSVSPHKNSALLNEIGEAAAAEFGLNWIHSDFKKQNGYKRSVELSKKYGLYRQNYCGCKYSINSSDRVDTGK